MKRIVLCLIAIASIAGAQQTRIPIRAVGAAEAVSTDTVGFLYAVRELSDGRVLANDAGSRRLLMFDKQLGKATVVADSVSGSRKSYGKRPTNIIPYRGDTTLLVDLASRSFVVLDGNGTAVRVMSPPRADDVPFLWNPVLGTPGFDDRGRLIYRGTIMPTFPVPEPGKPIVMPQMPDSAPLVRGDFDKRTVDTLAWIGIPKIKISVSTGANGSITGRPMINPVSFIDDWAMMADGSVAILRGRDYHIDWISPAGTMTSLPKMPFDWKRLTDAEKVALIDSTKAALERQAAGLERPAPTSPMAIGNHSMTVTRVDASDGGPTPRATAATTTTHAASGAPEVVSSADLPDYMPPVLRSGTMKVDPNGSIWVLPSTSSQSFGGLLYDVINRRGEVFERVRLPAGRALVGFGSGGVVYLTVHGRGGTRLERARIGGEEMPAPQDSVTKLFAGTWEGPYTSDHASGALKMNIGRDSVWHAVMSISAQMVIPPVTLTDFTVVGNKLSWSLELMGGRCSGSATLADGVMGGAVVCDQVHIPFSLKRK